MKTSSVSTEMSRQVVARLWECPCNSSSANPSALKELTAEHIAGTANTLEPFFIVNPLQTQKIVTTDSGTMFLHSGTNNSFDPNPPPWPGTNLYSKGLCTSSDGQNWMQANNGITGGNCGGAERSLTVDGDRVFIATVNGKISYLDTNDSIFSDGFDD